MKAAPPRKTILAPIDFSEASGPVLATAVELARASGARLVMLHVVQPPPVTDGDIGSQMSSEYAAMASEAAAKRLAELRGQLRAGPLVVQTTHHVGLPGACIIEEAKNLSAACIVLGSHGHGALHDLVVGSTTRRVLRHAKCPVVVVPANAARGRRRKKRLPSARGGPAP